MRKRVYSSAKCRRMIEIVSAREAPGSVRGAEGALWWSGARRIRRFRRGRWTLDCVSQSGVRALTRAGGTSNAGCALIVH